MTFTNRNVGQMLHQMKQAAGALMAPQEVDLFTTTGQPPLTVSVRLHVGIRRGSDSDLTGGTVQDNQFAVIDVEDWDAKAGRPPQIGDVIHWANRRYAVEDCQLSAPAGQPAFYRSRLRG